MILLGWEIGTGRRVEIPDTGHLAWFGQTQLSGKTTALEAIAFRGELKAVAFVTKQGEGGFLTGRTIPPYFSEPTNDEEQPLWRWVKSILEAGQQRRMNFEESWIIRACEDPRQAKTLKDVHENIKALLAGAGHWEEKRGRKHRVMAGIQKKKWIVERKPVSGINAGVYTSLKAYFDIVMPQLARLPYTKKLVLGAGLNVMDLREYAMETQALVIRSVMEWVYQHEKGVRVIVPEAQDFVPQGKNSPVKMACETLVRKAGANRNFMWLDSQDMAAVDKIMLRACSIVGIGVQTEAHEIERSLDGLFMPTLRPIDIARLKIGEFFVRTSEARVQKCYVQPAWMDSELHAQAIARGEESVSTARQMLKAFKSKMDRPLPGRKAPAPPQLLQVQIQEQESTDDVPKNESLSESDDIPAASRESADRTVRAANTNGPVDAGLDPSLIWRSSSPKNSPQTPSPENLNDEASDYAKDETSAGDAGVPGSAFRSENASENAPIPETVPRASVPVPDDGQDRRESEGAMPKETPAEIVTRVLDQGVMPTERTLRDLLRDHAALIDAHDAMVAEVRKAALKVAKEMLTPDDTPGNGHGLRFTVPDLDYIWKYVKAKAEKDSPAILEILTRRPELRVKVERTVVHADGTKLNGRLALLVHEGFFDKAKTRSDVATEMRRRAWLSATANLKILSPSLSELARLGFLTIEGDAFQSVPEMKNMVQKA